MISFSFLCRFFFLGDMLMLFFFPLLLGLLSATLSLSLLCVEMLSVVPWPGS